MNSFFMYLRSIAVAFLYRIIIFFFINLISIINLLSMHPDKSFKENYFQSLQSNFKYNSNKNTPSPYFAYKPNNKARLFNKKSSNFAHQTSDCSFKSVNKSCEVSRKNNITETDIEYDTVRELIKFQSNNINTFKSRIQREKSKVTEIFDIFQRQSSHFIQDAKLSFLAALDSNYKDYMEQYSLLNGVYRQIENQHNKMKNYNICSQCKTNNFASGDFLVQGQISNYRNKIIEGIEILTLSQAPFYQRQKLEQTIKKITKQIDFSLKEIQACLPEFIYSNSDAVFLKKASEKKLERDLKCQLSSIKHPSDKCQKSSWEKSLSEKYSKNNKQKSMQKSFNNSKIGSHSKNYSNLHNISNNYSYSNNSVIENSIIKQSKQLNAATMKLDPQITIQTNHQGAVLCISFISNYIATGSKDKTVKIYDLKSMKLVKTLKNADASICCLTTVNSLKGDLLAAGTDHGCCSVILWNPQTWQLEQKIKIHDAAVSAIVDLSDGHIISGSYDKKIFVSNIIEKQHFYANSTSKSPITGLAIVKDKLVASGLDQTLHIYIVVPNSKNSYTILFHQTIFVNHIICSMIPIDGLGYDAVVCGMKDGFLHLYDAQSGNIKLNLKPQENSILGMLAIPSVNNQPRIIACTSLKRNTLSLINLMNNCVQNIDTKKQMDFQYGCGIGPMIIRNQQNEKLAIINQSQQDKSFTIFSLRNHQ